MKIFIGGSKLIKSLPEAVENKLKEYIEIGVDILVGDCYGADRLMQEYLYENNYQNVTVYAANGQARNNVGNWSVCAVPPRDRDGFNNPYHHFHDKDLEMEKESDCGFMVWNGTSKATFMNILNLIDHKKPVEVYLTKDNKIWSISKSEDMWQLLPPKRSEYTRRWEFLPQSLYLSALNKVMPSQEMKAFLSENYTTKGLFIQMITYSPIPLLTKYEVCQQLSCTDNLFAELLDEMAEKKIFSSGDGAEGLYHNIHKDFSYHAKQIKQALDALKLKPNEYLRLIVKEYIGETCREKGTELATFSDFESAQNFISDYVKNWNDDTLCWLQLDKLIHSTNEKLDPNPYSYFFTHDKLTFFSKNGVRKDDSWYNTHDYFDPIIGIHLLIPFQAGEIVKVDCRPFAPITFAVIMESDGDLWGTRALYREKNGNWRIQWINIYHPLKRPSIELSPLYNLSSYNGELADDYSFFAEVRKAIYGNSEMADKLLYAIVNELEDEFSDELTDNEFMSLWNSGWQDTYICDKIDSDELYEEIINSCIESHEMQNWLKQPDHISYDASYLTDIVLGCALTLSRKYELLMKISPDNRACIEIRNAIESLGLKSGELFYLRQHWYDDDLYDENESGTAPFLSLNAAMDCLHHMMEDEEWDNDTCCWTSLEKWIPGTDGKMDNPYTYYLIRDEIVFFERNIYDEENHWWRAKFKGYRTLSRTDLILSIPFQVGDIVTLDIRPFGAAKHALLIEVDNSDCCGVQMLYREDDDDLWHTAALKHCHGWSYLPLLSPLYRLSRFDGVLEESEKVLKSVQQYIDSDVDKGKKFWKDMYALHLDGISDEKLLELINGK